MSFIVCHGQFGTKNHGFWFFPIFFYNHGFCLVFSQIFSWKLISTTLIFFCCWIDSFSPVRKQKFTVLAFLVTQPFMESKWNSLSEITALEFLNLASQNVSWKYKKQFLYWIFIHLDYTFSLKIILKLTKSNIF